MFAKRMKGISKLWNEISVTNHTSTFSTNHTSTFSTNHTSTFSSFTVTRRKEVWDLLSAVCVERRPIITAPLIDIEIKFQKLLQDCEYEDSYKSDYEVRTDKERKQAELLKKGELDIEVDLASKQTTQDLKDAYQEELSKFQFAERVTEADKKKDLQSLNKLLDKYLFLVINQKIGNDFKWIFPQGIRENGETMRQAAERILVERCGTNLQAQFLGNAPCGFYKYRYPVSVHSESVNASVGAKVFFFKAWHRAGQAEKSEYKWLSLDDLNTSVQGNYCNSISQFLIAV